MIYKSSKFLTSDNQFFPSENSALVASSFTDVGENFHLSLKSIFASLIARKRYLMSELSVRRQLPAVALAQDKARLDGGLAGRYQWVRLHELSMICRELDIRKVCEFGSGGSTALWNTLCDGPIVSVEQSEYWRSRTLGLLPTEPKVNLMQASRKVIEWEGEVATCYDLPEEFFYDSYDLVYIDGPTAVPINSAESVALSQSWGTTASQMPNIDIERFLKLNNPPRVIVVDGRRATVRRLCAHYEHLYDIYLRYFYVPRGQRSSNFLYHTIFIRR